jgi:hypothetical protein
MKENSKARFMKEQNLVIPMKWQRMNNSISLPKQRSRISRSALTALCLIAACLISACGKKETVNNNQMAKEYVYSAEELVLNLEGDYVDIRAAKFINEKIKMVIFSNEYSGGGEIIMPRDVIEDKAIPEVDMAIDEEALVTEDADIEDVAEVAGEDAPAAEDEAAEGDTVADDTEATGADASATEDTAADDGEVTDVAAAIPEDEIESAEALGLIAAEPVMPILPVQEYRAVLRLMTCNMDGSDVTSLELAIGQDKGNNYWLNNVILADSGDVYAIWGGSRETAESTPENPMYEDVQLAACYSGADGSLIWEIPIEDIQSEDGGYSFIASMNISNDGKLQLLVNHDYTSLQLVTLDSSGKTENNMDIEMDVQNMGNTFWKSDGNLLITSYNNEYTKILATEVDTTTGTASSPQEMQVNFNNYNPYPGAEVLGADMILSNNIGLYTYSIGDTEVKQLMSFLNSDFPTSYLQYMSVIDETHLLVVYNDNDAQQTKVAVLTKVNPEDIPDKEVIILGQNGMWGNTTTMIRNFNKTNEKYRIVARDYSQYATMEDYQTSYTQMNNDIISGNMPDILLLDTYQLDINAYISKGLFTDLREFIEKDPELSDKEFMENVFRAASGGEEWYCLIPGFSVNTIVGKSSILGDRQGWNFDEFVALMDSLPEGTQSFSEMTKLSFISQFMYYCSQDFVDPNTGKCSFNSPEFISLLEYANTFPEEINYQDYDENYWMNYQDQYRTGETILQQTNIYNVASYKYLVSNFGEEVTFVGYPTKSLKGSSFSYSSPVVISSKSSQKEGAWEFVRTYLLDEYQKQGYDGMPIRKDIFLEKAQEAMNRPYYMDGDTKVEYDETNYINGEEVIMPPLTQEQVDKVVAYIESVDTSMSYNQDLLDIINEETTPFFQGQKTAAEVADIIQSRAQIFVNENR